MDYERKQAAADFLEKELKWRDETILGTKWSPSQEVLWVTLKDESVVTDLYVRQVALKRNNVKLLKYIPSWAYERNKGLDINCRLARGKSPDLRT